MWLALVPVAGAATPTWGSAQEVPSTATLNAGGYAGVNSVSCASAGNCAAGGYYSDGLGAVQAFVADEVGGAWVSAQEVPGTATLNAGGSARVNSVSCASAGNCAAGGFYKDSSGGDHAFVVDEVGGVWGSAQEVSGTATLNAGNTEVTSVSCRSAGNCAAGGSYNDGSGNVQAFVVDEVGGVWGSAQEVPGTGTLNAGGYAEVGSVSCASAGNCAAGGFYKDSSGRPQAFVVDEVGGVWGSAQEVPGTATLNAGGDAAVYSVSCAAAGNCAAGGFYEDGSGALQAFVVDETGGVWGSAQEVPGTGTLNAGGNAGVYSLSCASAGNCAAGGYYEDGSGHFQTFVVDEVSGVWDSAQEVPGTATLNAGGYALTYSVSCPSAGNCAAGGLYKDGSGHFQAHVVSETGGTWGTAEEVPSTATLNAGGNAGVYSVSCASVDNCAGGGYFEDGSSRARAFVVDAPGSAPTGAPLAPSQGPGSGGTVVTPAEANLHPRPVPRPIVRRLSRKKGPKSGGTKVTIIGKNLLAPKAVRFGTKVARIRKVISATKIEVVSPKAKRTGTVAVRVTTSGGTSARTKADHFRYVRVRRHSAGR